MFSLGLVLFQLCCGDRTAWWPSDVDARPDADAVQAIVATLQDAAAFAQWAPVDAAWPLADVIRRCLSFDPAQRPTAAQLRDELLAAAPWCLPGPGEAFCAVAEQRNWWLLHESRGARAQYQAPFATARRGLARVPTVEEKQRAHGNDDEEAKQVAHDVRPVTAALDEFLASSDQRRVLVLLGDGGVGKSLTLQRLVESCLIAGSSASGAPAPAEAPAPARARWQALQLRPALSGSGAWSHAGLRGAVQRALRWYAGAVACPGDARLVVLLDGYDELALAAGGAADDDLPRALGLDEPALAGARVKLVVTARRTTVPEGELARRFGPGSGALYLLPFTAAQMETLMRQRGLAEAQIARAQSLRAVVENPFLLQLYCECWPEVEALAARHWRAGAVRRRHVYEAALRRCGAGSARPRSAAG